MILISYFVAKIMQIKPNYALKVLHRGDVFQISVNTNGDSAAN